MRGHLGGADRDHRGELGRRRADSALPHLPQDGLPPLPGGARRADRVHHSRATLRDQLFEFQTAAVKIAAHHLNQRGGVLIGDVVGLGKTLMATALARIFEDDYLARDADHLPQEPGQDVGGLPRRVPPAGQGAVHQPRASTSCPTCAATGWCSSTRATTCATARASATGPSRSTSRRNESRCILLSATPYNKTYLDLSNQLRLFVPEDRRPGHPPGAAAARASARSSSTAAPVRRCARWRPLRRASTPTTGAS